MGLAATQARFLECTARKSNVEYQGQQINEQRTLLANKSSAMYNQMLVLKVPTPPSQTDFTRIIYSGEIDGTPVTLSEKQVATIKATITNADNIDATYSGSASSYQQSKSADGNKVDINGNKYFFVARTGSTDKNYYPNSINTSTNRLAGLCLTTAALTFQAGSTDEIKAKNDTTYNENVTYFTVKEEIDQAAYDDAYNQYKYDQYVYEKEIQDINSQTSILQQQDKVLELQLKQLDTEQSALKTELEALDKVVGDAVESGYKTFGG